MFRRLVHPSMWLDASGALEHRPYSLRASTPTYSVSSPELLKIGEKASPHLETIALLDATSTKLVSLVIRRLRGPVDYEWIKLDCEISCILRVGSHYLILQLGD